MDIVIPKKPGHSKINHYSIYCKGAMNQQDRNKDNKIEMCL